MVVLSPKNSGEIGKDVFFSDLYAAAIATRFTGAILVRAPKDQAVFFRGGVPVHASGSGFEGNHLGELLLKNGDVTADALNAALDKQERAQGQRPLLGLLLMADAGVQRDALKRAMIAQTEARTLSMFAIADGTWQSGDGENARIKEIGVPASSPSLLLNGIKQHASDDELRAMSDALLGRAVQVVSASALPELGFDEADRQVLRYLEKPRKPDQLERAVNNRRTVRAMLRVLSLMDKLKLGSATSAIPISKKSGGTQDIRPTGDLAETTPTPRSTVPATPTPPPKKERVDAALISEARALHAELDNKTHFEILGVTEATNPAELRKAFTAMQKRFHPDAFIGVTDEDLLQVVRELSARMNEAYSTLTNEKTRAEYIALLGGRFKGDARKQDRSRDADVKHQMGLVMLKKREYQKARELFNVAMQFDPEQGEYKASMAWAIFADPKTERGEANAKAYALLLDALRTHPTAMVHYYQGQVLKARNQNDEALYHFKRANELDPKNPEAAREFRLMSSRKGKSKESSGGLLDKIFKR